MRGVAAAALLLSLAGCQAADRAAPRHAGPPPNVLLVSIDTLRADRLSSYGYARQTTPFLDQIAREGIRFSHAYATSSWTVPSVVSLLSSLEPETHGIVDGHRVVGDVVQQTVIPEQTRLLAEALKGAGWRTFGITTNGHLHPEFGFAQGFDRYSNAWADAPHVTRTARGWRDEIVGGEAPWFLWVHYLDPHLPYTPRPRWLAQYHPGWEAVAAGLPQVAAPAAYGHVDRDSEVFAYLNAAYDAELNFVDEEIRKLFEILGVSKADLVLVTADHGEEFLEHDSFGHAFTLYEEQLRVPLLVRLPGGQRAATSLHHPVSLVDVMPSLLAFLGLRPEPDAEGCSLFEPGRARPIRASLSRSHVYQSVRLGRWKYIQDLRSGGQRSLYDLERDPGERRDLLTHGGVGTPLRARWLQAHLRAPAPPRTAANRASLTQEQAAQLRALGYVE